MRHVNTRHNRLVRILAKFLDRFLKPRENWEIHIEKPAIHYGQNLKPDIQLINQTRKTYYIIDVKSPYEQTENLSQRDRDNINYYQCIVDAAEVSLQGWNVQVMTFIVGTIGGWYINNRPNLAKLSLTGKIIDELEYDCGLSAALSEVWKYFIGNAEGAENFIMPRIRNPILSVLSI